MNLRAIHRHQAGALVVALLFSGIFLYLAVHRVEWTALKDTARQIQPFPGIPLACACYVLGQVFRGVRCRFMVGKEANLSLATVTNIVVIGYAFNNLLPARLGEVVRAGMLSERTGLPLLRSITITAVERLLDGLVILSLFALLGSRLHPTGWIAASVEVAALVLGGAVLGLGVVLLFPDLGPTLMSRWSAPLGKESHDRLVRGISAISGGLASLRSLRGLLIAGSLSGTVWLCEAAMFAAILPVVGLPVQPDVALVTMAATNLGILAPSTPGFIGAFHFFCSQALGAAGVSSEVAVTYAFLVHLTFYLPITFWGVGVMMWYGLELGSTALLARAASGAPVLEPRIAAVLAHSPPAPPPARPSRFLSSLVEVIVRMESPSGMVEGTRDALQDTSRFVQGQMDALPWSLRQGCFLGLRMLQGCILLRYLRPLEGLQFRQQNAVVLFFSHGPIPWSRQLCRVVRSPALLAWYEHPAVLEVLHGARAQAPEGPPPGGNRDSRTESDRR